LVFFSQGIIVLPPAVAIYFSGGIIAQNVNHGTTERPSILGLGELTDNVITVQDPDEHCGGDGCGGHWFSPVDSLIMARIPGPTRGCVPVVELS